VPRAPPCCKECSTHKSLKIDWRNFSAQTPMQQRTQDSPRAFLTQRHPNNSACSEQGMQPAASTWRETKHTQLLPYLFIPVYI